MKKCILTNTGAKIQHCARTHKSFCKVLPFISNILSHIKNNCIPHHSTSCRAQARRHLTDGRKGARTRRTRTCGTSAHQLQKGSSGTRINEKSRWQKTDDYRRGQRKPADKRLGA